jgi:hypothetical protein
VCTHPTTIRSLPCQAIPVPRPLQNSTQTTHSFFTHAPSTTTHFASGLNLAGRVSTSLREASRPRLLPQPLPANSPTAMAARTRAARVIPTGSSNIYSPSCLSAQHWKASGLILKPPGLFSLPKPCVARNAPDLRDSSCLRRLRLASTLEKKIFIRASPWAEETRSTLSRGTTFLDGLEDLLYTTFLSFSFLRLCLRDPESKYIKSLLYYPTIMTSQFRWHPFSEAPRRGGFA